MRLTLLQRCTTTQTGRLCWAGPTEGSRLQALFGWRDRQQAAQNSRLHRTAGAVVAVLLVLTGARGVVMCAVVDGEGGAALP